MNIKQLLLAFLFSSFAFLLSGCAGGGDIKFKSGLPPLSTIDTAPPPTIVEQPFVRLPAQVWGAALGGAIGAAITADTSDSDKYLALIKSGNIDIQGIAKKSLLNRLNAKTSLIRNADKASDAELRIHVSFYGIHGSDPFSATSLEPMLGITVSLMGKDGTPIWRATEELKFPDEKQVSSHTMKEYVETPQLLADGYARLSDLIAVVLVDKLIAEVPISNLR